MRIPHLIALAVLGALAMASAAPAQYGRYNRPNYGPGYRGNISPYLNLLRNNNANNFGLNAGINYYLGTRSEQQRRANTRQFQEEIRGLELEQLTITSGTVPQRNTMQRYFNNTGGYFPPVGR